MDDHQDQMRRAVREAGRELSRALEQASRLARQAAEDFTRLVGDPRSRGARRRADGDRSPADGIRDLARLRDEGLVTEEEFQAKKAELLSRL